MRQLPTTAEIHEPLLEMHALTNFSNKCLHYDFIAQYNKSTHLAAPSECLTDCTVLWVTGCNPGRQRHWHRLGVQVSHCVLWLILTVTGSVHSVICMMSSTTVRAVSKCSHRSSSPSLSEPTTSKSTKTIRLGQKWGYSETWKHAFQTWLITENYVMRTLLKARMAKSGDHRPGNISTMDGIWRR